MKYEELDDRAKDRALDKWRENEPIDEWWDHTYADAVTVGALMGIEIGYRETRSGSNISGSSDISFSGFCSQGDGACWSGRLRVADMAGALEKMKCHASQDEELHRLALLAESIHAQVTVVVVAQRLDDEDPEYPECTSTMSITVTGKERGFITSVTDDDLPPGIDQDCRTLAEDFANWIYKQLEAEYDYLTSKDTFLAWAKDNDIDFDENGNPE